MKYIEKDNDVQGVGVYAEFTLNSSTTQILLVPDGYTQEGSLVPATVIRRNVTTDSPKKQWRMTRLPEVTTNPELSDDAKQEYADERLKHAVMLLDQLLRGEWKMVKQPIVLEVSRKDYDSLAMHKTPTKLIYRLNQSRTKLDFPANLVDTGI